MHTLAPAGLACHHAVLQLSSREPTGFIDLTECLADFVASSRVQLGTLSVQTRHTTTAVVVNEHEPRLLADFRQQLEALVPACGTYAHDDLALRADVPPDERRNGHAHCRALLLPTSASVNVIDGRLALGRWQRILFVELDGPRARQVAALVMGTSL